MALSLQHTSSFVLGLALSQLSFTAAQGAGQLTLTPLPVSKTYPAGTASPIQGAPPLPGGTIDPSKYPPLDQVPPTDSDVVREWLSKIDMSKIPNIKPNGANLCTNTTVNADAISKAGAQNDCWWSCGGCTRDSDVTVCPGKGTWGASFDDGPSEYTPNLLQYLDQNKLKATFFIVGSRAISRPEILRDEYMKGYELCLHTWSHPALTTLTNEQIVAEIAWTAHAFKEILGVVPQCIRAPYGDVNDRVRYIFTALGLQSILWTRNGNTLFDTDDWRVVDGSVSGETAVKTFEGFLNLQSSMSTGFIVLAHDLYAQTVAFSMKYVIPAALKTPGVSITGINTCLGHPLTTSYFETAGSSKATPPTSNSGNKTNPNGVTSAPNTGTGGATTPPNTATGGATTSPNTTSTKPTTSTTPPAGQQAPTTPPATNSTHSSGSTLQIPLQALMLTLSALNLLV